jgi:hypothetical protein
MRVLWQNPEMLMKQSCWRLTNRLKNVTELLVGLSVEDILGNSGEILGRRVFPSPIAHPDLPHYSVHDWLEKQPINKQHD